MYLQCRLLVLHLDLKLYALTIYLIILFPLNLRIENYNLDDDMNANKEVYIQKMI